MVENSVRHGLEPKIEGGEITVRVRREDRHLIVEIEDDGVGLDEAALTPRPLVENASGFGLHQVRRRLTSIYGKTATLDLLPAPNGGTRAVLVLPEESGARIK
jgi:LytS/YehU family sensor histidine kinase